MSNQDAAEIWRLHMQGLAPSQIARRLDVTWQAAHDAVVRRWAEDRARHERVRDDA